MSVVVILTTVGRDFDASALAQSLVGQRLAACVNIVDGIQSIYRWEDRVTTDDERLLIIKTTGDRVEALRSALFAQHPYDVPEFVVLPVASVSESYGAWVQDAVSGATPD